MIDDTMVVDVITYNVMRLIELPVVVAEAVDGAEIHRIASVGHSSQTCCIQNGWFDATSIVRYSLVGRGREASSPTSR